MTEEEYLMISQLLKKSIPKETDLIESTLGGALKALVKRLEKNKPSSKK